MMNNIAAFWEMICRMAWWAWKMRKNYDWDFAYLYMTIHYKLQRMDKVLLSGKSPCVWTTQTQSRMYRSLKEAKEIARRLAEGNEDMKYTLAFHDRFGYNSKSLLSLPLDKDIEKISDKLYNKMYKTALEKDKKHYKKLKARFYYLLNTFGEYWWD